MICVIDYGAGNITSVARALSYLGFHYRVTSDEKHLRNADKVIFPGVGAASHAMGVLKSRGLDEALKAFAQTGKPLLGICLGAQILQERSQENNGTELLGLIPGEVMRFYCENSEGRAEKTETLKVPHIGWNTVSNKPFRLFNGIAQDSSFYFVHSYFISLSKWTMGRTEYGIEFASVIGRDNIVGIQFHPEKSGPAGLKLLDNFLKDRAA